jgi:hypothetical protein
MEDQMSKYCQKPHRDSPEFESLPTDQGGKGRHKCAGCAYDAGLGSGLNLEESVELKLDNLRESQAGTVRHKSPHAAWAKGYLDGVALSYKVKQAKRKKNPK